VRVILPIEPRGIHQVAGRHPNRPSYFALAGLCDVCVAHALHNTSESGFKERDPV
jgi:hypothetical protein